MAEGRVSRLNAICVVDSSGEIVSEGTVISEPVAIAEFIRAKAAGAKHIGLETGPMSMAEQKGPPWRCKKGPLGGCGLVP